MRSSWAAGRAAFFEGFYAGRVSLRGLLFSPGSLRRVGGVCGPLRFVFSALSAPFALCELDVSVRRGVAHAAGARRQRRCSAADLTTAGASRTRLRGHAQNQPPLNFRTSERMNVFSRVKRRASFAGTLQTPLCQKLLNSLACGLTLELGLDASLAQPVRRLCGILSHRCRPNGQEE